uniref:SWIM-type domain-containing protein n=1 Tax=Tanacetum cinerariifolium TaxID=118510 RepID=A0A699H8U2_TANCI|nr:hypothetical protein [Tanacetum cinerariifolium]
MTDNLTSFGQVILESNPGSTSQLKTEGRDDGKIYFKMMNICFKGIKQGVENKDNWAWFLSLLQEDLELGYGGGLTVISNGHKFLQKIEQIKELDPAAHKWLVERNPISWCRAFFEMNRFAAFENGISESFNSRIVTARCKPIITMLEDIRIYIIQRMCHMNKLSFKLEDTITPSVRKKLEYLKEKTMLVYPSAFREVKVRRGYNGYGVNLHTKKCGCKFWKLSGISCIHAMAAYYHMNMDPELEGDALSHMLGGWEQQERLSKLTKTQTPRHGKRDRYEDKKRGNTNVLAGSSKIRGTIRIGSPIKKREDNQVTEGSSMGNLTAEHKMDMEALANVQREIATEEAEQQRIRQILAENEANDLYWENMAK